MTAKNDDAWMRDYFEDNVYDRPESGDSMKIAFEKLFIRVERLEAAIAGDILLRKAYPALDDAWQKYETVRNLVKDQESSK